MPSLTEGWGIITLICLVVVIPGAYIGAASRFYLYYRDEFKYWGKGGCLLIGLKARPMTPKAKPHHYAKIDAL